MTISFPFYGAFGCFCQFVCLLLLMIWGDGGSSFSFFFRLPPPLLCCCRRRRRRFMCVLLLLRNGRLGVKDQVTYFLLFVAAVCLFLFLPL